MSSTYFGHRIIHLESVDSTNNYTAKVFKTDEVPPGSVIMSDIQTDGRGQREKTWQSGAFENLTFSLTADINLWKINSLIDLNRLVAISLHSFLSQFELKTRIKWPNDIMLNDKKVCGILIENFFKNGKPKSVIGIGINVNQKEFDFPRATSLALQKKEEFNPKELLYQFIGTLNSTFEQIPLNDSEYIREVYDERLWKKNTTHQFTEENEKEFSGEILGTSIEGELIIKNSQQQASIKTYRNGEVRY